MGAFGAGWRKKATELARRRAVALCRLVTSPLPDAAPDNWVDRHAPAALRPWLKLGRLDRPTGIWLLMLPGWQGIALASSTDGDWPDAILLAKFAVGSALMRAAGCAYNDIVDRHIDAQVARTARRPIPAGDISVRGAWVFLIVCALASLAILLTLNILSLFLGVASLALVAAYPFMKRITWWPQAWLGLTFNWGALVGFAAARGGPSATNVLTLAIGAWASGFNLSIFTPGLPWAAALLYMSGVSWTLGYDTIYALQDLEDDALAGVKSSARRLGSATPIAVMGFYAANVVLVTAAWLVAGLGPWFLAAAILYAAHLSLQASRLRVDDPVTALALFKSNALAGLLLFIALVVGRWRT
jgi:4-hydroxybenzoate polyprenyltransferase